MKILITTMGQSQFEIPEDLEEDIREIMGRGDEDALSYLTDAWRSDVELTDIVHIIDGDLSWTVDF